MQQQELTRASNKFNAFTPTFSILDYNSENDRMKSQNKFSGFLPLDQSSYCFWQQPPLIFGKPITSIPFGIGTFYQLQILKYQPTLGQDVFGSRYERGIYSCITCMPEYISKSLEELRWEDYLLSNKATQDIHIIANSFIKPAQLTTTSTSQGSAFTAKSGFSAPNQWAFNVPSSFPSAFPAVPLPNTHNKSTESWHIKKKIAEQKAFVSNSEKKASEAPAFNFRFNSTMEKADNGFSKFTTQANNDSSINEKSPFRFAPMTSTAAKSTYNAAQPNSLTCLYYRPPSFPSVHFANSKEQKFNKEATVNLALFSNNAGAFNRNDSLADEHHVNVQQCNVKESPTENAKEDIAVTEKIEVINSLTKDLNLEENTEFLTLKNSVNAMQQQLHDTNKKILELLQNQSQLKEENQNLRTDNTNLTQITKLLTEGIKDSIDSNKRMEAAFINLQQKNGLNLKLQHKSNIEELSLKTQKVDNISEDIHNENGSMNENPVQQKSAQNLKQNETNVQIQTINTEVASVPLALPNKPSTDSKPITKQQSVEWVEESTADDEKLILIFK